VRVSSSRSTFCTGSFFRLTNLCPNIYVMEALNMEGRVVSPCSQVSS
jgi:hypothetical protein